MESAAWPLDHLEQALEALARWTGLADGEGAVPLTGPGEEPGPRIARGASRLGLEAEPVESLHGDVERMLTACGPALVLLPEGRLLAVTACRRGRLRVLGPDLQEHRLPAAEVARALTAELEGPAGPAGPAVTRLVERAGVPGRRREGVRAALLGERLRRRRVAGVWLLRLPPGSGFLRQMLQAGLHRNLFGFVAAYTVSYGLLLASWGALGVGALQGRLVPGALAAWALLLLTLVPFRLVSVWSRARLIVGLGALLKRRLLAGALKLQPEEIRHQGAGQLLSRVIESEAVETLALHGGFLTVVGLIETALAAVVVAAGSGGGRHLLLLALWVLVTLGLARWFFRHRREWTARRLEMTHGLVERLVGHRTRLVQEPRERWHLEEDRLLDAYLRDSGRLDRSKAVLLAAAPRGWLLAGLAGLLPGFLAGTSSPALLALGVGGTLAAYRGLAKISEGFGHLSGALLSWQQAEDLFRAAARNEPAGARVSPARPDTRQDAVVLEALDLSYRHRGRGRAVLDGCALRVARGERLLLEGPSGGGKSTLAALLTGLREPGSGLVLLDGVDRHTVGTEAWRRRVVLAPQFHENHVFTETFGFNLLMGRGWPAGEADLAEAVAVCRELGLGGLLDRMPAGLQQIVGETGWQLSHGERSRVYMARALLQGAEVVVLDESFAALDPENLHQALDCALRRAPTLVVIAHP